MCINDNGPKRLNFLKIYIFLILGWPGCCNAINPVKNKWSLAVNNSKFKYLNIRQESHNHLLV